MDNALVFGRKNFMITIISFVMIVVAYIIMSLDNHPYGYGIWGLTIGPLLLISGFGLPFYAIFSIGSRNQVQLTKYDKIINSGGWIVLAVSLIIYVYTAEPTTSFWDCGEFIAAACKLEIPHPPGAPLYLLIGRIFSLFAPEKELIAFSINMVSAVASALTALVLYASIVILVKKIYNIKAAGNYKDTLLLVCSATTGSLALAFSDSLWFNATEAEVYALSSLLSSVTFWGVLQWEKNSERPGSAKWLLFIAYLTGLSTGVHLLNLLTLPVLETTSIFYFHTSWDTSTGGIFYGILQAENPMNRAQGG